MFFRIFFLVKVALLASTSIHAQIYTNDSLKIDIKSQRRFVANRVEDLNIDIVYTNRSVKRSVAVYTNLINAYRNTFGNCYYELYKYDSVFGGFKNITLELRGSTHAPKDFENEEDILRYDTRKAPLRPGGRKTLTFNLLNFIGYLAKGEYSMTIYIRTGTTFGYDEKGHLIASSVDYVESVISNFEVPKDMVTPNKP